MEGDEFTDALSTLGFRLVQRDRRRRVAQFARQPNRFLTEWVHDFGPARPAPEATPAEALFTWEFAMGELCDAMGWRMSGADQLLYPQYDARIARDIDAVAAEINRLEQLLRSLDFADPAL